jgi:hypothetical protein
MTLFKPLHFSDGLFPRVPYRLRWSSDAIESSPTSKRHFLLKRLMSDSLEHSKRRHPAKALKNNSSITHWERE